MTDKITKYIKHPSNIVVFLQRRCNFPVLPDKVYLKIKYKLAMGKKLDLDNPQTFNEKLQWLKLYDRKPEYTRMVDKYEVKKYVAEMIGEQYIIPTLGVWDHFDEIDFNSLPDQFVLKCTHDSGGLVIVRDKSKIDKAVAKKKIEKSLQRNYYWTGREWPYKNVKPRIIAETYISDGNMQGLTDYKFMCFNGRMRTAFTVTERFSNTGLRVTFFDREWNRMSFQRHYPASEKKVLKPYNLDKMIDLSEKISRDMPFARIDFYEKERRIYFGEITFYPGSGMEEFNPEIWDEIMGEWIQLPCDPTKL